LGEEGQKTFCQNHIASFQIEYPKFVHTHSLASFPAFLFSQWPSGFLFQVVGQVVRQWTANLLSLCDQCLQGGISLFLEWLLASEFGPVEDKAAEFRRRVGEARQRLMGSEHRVRQQMWPKLF
jgi:hypothetical protein